MHFVTYRTICSLLVDIVDIINKVFFNGEGEKNYKCNDQRKINTITQYIDNEIHTKRKRINVKPFVEEKERDSIGVL